MLLAATLSEFPTFVCFFIAFVCFCLAFFDVALRRGKTWPSNVNWIGAGLAAMVFVALWNATDAWQG